MAATKKSVKIEDLIDGKTIVIKPIYNNKTVERVSGDARYPGGPFIIRAAVDAKRYRYMVDITEEELKAVSKAVGRDISINFDNTNPNWFWDINPLTRIDLDFDTNVIVINDVYAFVKYRILRAHPLIAKSFDDYESGKAKNAKFYIVDPSYEVRKTISKATLKKEAFDLYGKLTRDEKDALLAIMVMRDYTKSSNDAVDAAIFELIENQKTIQKYVQLARTIKDGSENEKQKIITESLINRAISQGVIKRGRNGSLNFEFNTWPSKEEAIVFLMQPKNSAVVINIAERLKK